MNKIISNEKIEDRLQAHGWNFKRDVYIPYDLFYSEAFNSLTLIQVKVLMRFLQKREFRYEGTGKKKRRVYLKKPIIFTYTEATSLKISTSSFKISIRVLIEKGFLKVEHQGGSCGNGCDWSTYSYLEDWKLYGTDKFKPRNKSPVICLSKGFDEYNKNRKADSPQSSVTMYHSHP